MRLCLYDLTNFYFEGRKEGSTLAQFGRSKEKRNDAKLISLALLTNGQGFIRRSKIYSGNISEPSTLREVISELEVESKKDTDLFDSKPVAVMDAGIATEENLEFLRDTGFDYICVSRSNLQDYSLAEGGCKTVFDNRKHPIEISIATPEGKQEGDLYLYVKSAMKGHGRIETRRCEVFGVDLMLEEIKNNWKNLNTIIKITSTREYSGKIETHERFYISSLLSDNDFNKHIRSHWGVENGLHWVLDMTFREDEQRKRANHADKNFAIVRKIALNLLKKDDGKGSLRMKRLKAAWNKDYVLELLKI